MHVGRSEASRNKQRKTIRRDAFDLDAVNILLHHVCNTNEERSIIYHVFVHTILINI